MENKIFLAIDGIPGAGKSYLLEKLKADLPFIYFIDEPVSEFKCFTSSRGNMHNPLQLLYENPNQNSSIVQMHILDVLEKWYDNTKMNNKYIIGERSLNSTKLFVAAQKNIGILNDFQFDYLNSKIDKLISKKISCNKLIFIDTDTDICLSRIRKSKRIEEDLMDNLNQYLQALRLIYKTYFYTFMNNYGPFSCLTLKTNYKYCEALEQIKRLMS